MEVTNKLLLSFFFLGSILLGHGQNNADLFEYDGPEPSVHVVKSLELDSLIGFEKLVLETSDAKVPFYHYMNKQNGSGDYVILMHGLGGNKDYWVYPSEPYLDYTRNLTQIKRTLLEKGYSLVIIDAKYHGERTYELDFRDPGKLPPMLSRNERDAETFYKLYVESIKEIRLMMSYLSERAGKSDLRFNLVGYSMGAAFALILNDIDERINCVVACVPPLSRPYSELEEFDWGKDLANKLRAISPLYGVKKQKSPVALLMGNDDFFIPVQEAREFYEKLSLDDKSLKLYNSGHELPSEYIDDVIDWLEQHNH